MILQSEEAGICLRKIIMNRLENKKKESSKIEREIDHMLVEFSMQASGYSMSFKVEDL